MQVTLTIEGGFAYVPGLARPLAARAEQLSTDDAATLRRLSAAACAAANKGEMPRAALVPDGRRYRLTVEMDGARVHITAADPVGDSAIAELIEFVQARGQR